MKGRGLGPPSNYPLNYWRREKQQHAARAKVLAATATVALWNEFGEKVGSFANGAAATFDLVDQVQTLRPEVGYGISISVT